MKLHEIHQRLGILQRHLTTNRLAHQEQAELKQLEVVDIDYEGKAFVVLSSTAQAWRAMTVAALDDQITLQPFSGFRSYIYQMGLIEKQMKNGRRLEEIFTQIAIPGFSEHHTGRAIDIHAKDRPVLDEEFELTAEFRWLEANAARFNFRLSYSRTNSQGIIFEPWHWFYLGD